MTKQTLCLFFICISIFGYSGGASAEKCRFDLKQSDVVGYGDLMSFPGLWNNEASTVLATDQSNGNILLYPQMMPGTSFYDAMLNKTMFTERRKEIFMFFDKEGKHKWTATAYSSTFPVVEKDVFIMNEREVTKLDQHSGHIVWTTSLCTQYQASGVKQVNDIFPVVHGDSETELAVGILVTYTGSCSVMIDGEPFNLTASVPMEKDKSTPYIIYISKIGGEILRYNKFDPIEADLVRSALRSGNSTTFLGMVVASKQATLQHIIQHDNTGNKRWATSISTPHPHNFLWSQSYADAANEHVLFISDPTDHVEINGELVKHKGLLFGGIEASTGQVSWKKAIEYKGVITSTFIQYMDKGLVVLGAIWDGEDELDLGNLQLHKIRRPVQGMLGFIAVYDRKDNSFLYLQEVAPEMVYPGHHVGIYKINDGTYQIAACPAFWDEAPQRLVDNQNSVTLPKPDTDALVLVRYEYTACPGSARTSIPGRGNRGSRASGKLAVFMTVVMSLAFVLVVMSGIVIFLKRQGYVFPDLGIPNLFGKGRGYSFVAVDADDDYDEDPLGDIDYENDEL